MKIKIVLFLAVFLAICGSASAQGIRVPLSVTQQNTVAGITNVVTIPTTARIAFCSAPANGVPCSNLATTYTDSTLGTPCSTSTQIVLDGTNSCVAQLNSQATGGVWVPTGQYAFTVSYGGANFGPYFVTAGSTGTIGGSISINQVAFGASAGVLGGSASFQWSSPVANALNIVAPAVSCASNVGGAAAIALTNSTFVNTSYFQKCADGSLWINVDGQIIPNSGFLGFQRTNGAFGDVDLRAGAGGGSCYWNTVASVGIALPAGSVDCEFPNSGVGTAKFQLHSGTPNFTTYQWESSTGCIKLFTPNTTNFGGFCPPPSGTPNLMSAPPASPSAGQFLQGDGSNPTQLSWKTIGVQCGTISANGACANTLTVAEHCISGQATLAAGTSTITGISPAFTSSTSYAVITNDSTTIANPSKGAPVNGSSITFTGTGTDTLNFVACGG